MCFGVFLFIFYAAPNEKTPPNRCSEAKVLCSTSAQPSRGSGFDYPPLSGSHSNPEHVEARRMWRRRSFHAPNAIAAIRAKIRARLIRAARPREERRKRAVHLLIVPPTCVDDPGRRCGSSLHASAGMIYS